MAPYPASPDDQNCSLKQRKNELIMDKNLRVCTVNIRNKTGEPLSDCDKISFVKQTSEQSKHGQKQHFLPNCRSETPSESVSPVMEQATSPIALRYWNYCLNRSEERERGRTPTNAPWKVNSLNNSDISSKKNEEPPTRRTQTPLPYISASPVKNMKQRARSESVPRTFRTLRITARVESPIPMIQPPTDLNPSKSNSLLSERPPTENKEVVQVPTELKESKSTSPVLEKPPIRKKEIAQAPTELKESKSNSPVTERPPTPGKKDMIKAPSELKESKSTSPVSERPPTPRKMKQKEVDINRNNKSPTNESENTSTNDVETCTKHEQEVNCSNGSIFDHKQENRLNLSQSVLNVGVTSQDEINKLVLQLFSKASDDVKLSLILDCLPKLSVKRILSDMSDSEKEFTKERLRLMTQNLVHQKRKNHPRS